MTQQHQEQEEGWPLGLQPLNNMRVIGLSASSSTASNVSSGGGGGGGGSISFNTTLLSSVSPTNSSTDSSSLDLDSSQSTTGSFFHERITTFGRLIGASSTLDLSKRSQNRWNGKKVETYPRLWFFSICCRNSSDVEVVDSAGAPLSHLLAVERRRRRRSPNVVIGPYYDGLELMCQSTPESNSLFVDGRIAPPRAAAAASPWLSSGGDRVTKSSSVLLSWIC